MTDQGRTSGQHDQQGQEAEATGRPGLPFNGDVSAQDGPRSAVVVVAATAATAAAVAVDLLAGGHPCRG